MGVRLLEVNVEPLVVDGTDLVLDDFGRLRQRVRVDVRIAVDETELVEHHPATHSPREQFLPTIASLEASVRLSSDW